MQIFRAGEIVSAEGPEVFGHQVLLLKMPKDARPAPNGFSNLRVSATPNHKKSSYILLFRVHPPGYQTITDISIKLCPTLSHIIVIVHVCYTLVYNCTALGSSVQYFTSTSSLGMQSISDT